MTNQSESIARRKTLPPKEGSSDYEDEQVRQIPAMDSREKKHTLELLRPIKNKPGQLQKK